MEGNLEQYAEDEEEVQLDLKEGESSMSIFELPDDYRSAGIEIPEIVHKILIFCTYADIGRAMLISKTFYRISVDNRLWKSIYVNRANYSLQNCWDSEESIPLFLRYDKREYSMFQQFRIMANREWEIRCGRSRRGDEEQRLWRVRQDLDTWVPFLKILSIFCPSLSTILSYVLLRDKEENGMYFITNNFDNPMGLVSNLPYVMIFPPDPQLADCLCSACFSVTCCHCFIATFFCSYFGILRFESRLRNDNRMSPIGKLSTTFCSVTQVFCLPLILCIGGIFLVLSLIFMYNNDLREVGTYLFLALISPCILYVFLCLCIFNGRNRS